LMKMWRDGWIISPDTRWRLESELVRSALPLPTFAG
jgi:hypothetical protein